MSMISKMQIRGIRSFSPDKDETIEFYSPLTMIVGANGCGKTTIIESLKYACTGSLPPNIKNGQSFLNDPSMTDSSEVKASIKLQFQNRNEEVCVAVRSLQVVKKKSKLEFKTLDGVLKTTSFADGSSRGNKVSHSLKCSEMDRIIPNSLGISAAIVENVIFVHQEDSNWPMMEGITLKSRFDDIFESTRYTKALEALAKAKKEFVAKSKDLKVEVAEYSGHIVAISQLKNDLESISGSNKDCDEAIRSLETNIEKIQQEVDECEDVLTATRTGITELQQLQQVVYDQERRIKDKEKSIDTILTVPEAEMLAQLQNFDKVTEQKNRLVEELRTKVDVESVNLHEKREVVNQLIMKKGQSESLKSQSQQMQSQLLSLCQSVQLKNSFSLSYRWSVYEPKAVQALLDLLQQQISIGNSEWSSTRSALAAQIDKQQTLYNDAKTRQQAISIELRIKIDEQKNFQEEIASKQLELSRLSSARLAIQRCQEEYNSVKNANEEFLSNYDTKSNSNRVSIKTVTDEIRALQQQIDSDSQTLQDLSVNKDEIASIDANLRQVQQDLAQVETDIHYNFSLYKNELSAYSVPKSAEELVRILYDFTEKSESLSTEYNSSKNDLQQIQNNLAADEALLLEAEQKVKTTRNNCVELESKLEEYDKLVIKVNQLCESKELQGSDLTRTPLSASIHEKLDAAKCAEEEARSNVTIASSGLIFAKRLRKIRQKNGNRCPCCTQEMSPELIPVFDENVQKISDFVDVDTFGTIDDLNRIADEASACYSAMQGLYKLLLPLDEMHLTIVDGDIRIQQLKEKCDNYRKQIHKREAELLTMNTNKTSCAKVLSSFQTLQNTWQSLERRSADLTNNKKRLSQLLVFSDLGNRSINELEQQHRQHLEEKDSLQSKKDALQMEATKLTNKYFSIQTLLAEKERQVNEAKLSGNTYGEIENQIKVLLGRSTDAEISRTALESSQLLISTEVKDLLTELEKLKSDLKQKENVHNSKMICFQDDLDSLMKCRTTIDDIEQQYRALDINNMEDELDKAKQTAAHTEVRIKDLNAEIHSINTDLLKQSQDKKNVINNIDVLNLRRERDQLAQQLNELINEYPDGDLHDFLNDAENNYKRKQREKSDLMSKRDVLKGKAVVYLNQIDDIKSKLNSSTYKDVEKQHRQKFIEYETTMIAVSDLDSYHNALDKALQSFHTLKIRAINKIIRELWQLIYKGQDIDMIEIESGQEEGAVAKRGSRSYNYRVVMRKGDVPLDMRGRCSAGQKVLASIVIRLALAETFCLNCGLLALDEPTTNLDEANKVGLAHALARIIISRQQQHNFQLICITHDEEFVKLMNRELSSSAGFSMPEHYFRVFRNDEGNTGKFFSQIERIPWEDM